MPKVRTLKDVVKEFIDILDMEEANDDGVLFHPTHISSCRVMDCERMDTLIAEMKIISGWSKKSSTQIFQRKTNRNGITELCNHKPSTGLRHG